LYTYCLIWVLLQLEKEWHMCPQIESEEKGSNCRSREYYGKTNKGDSSQSKNVNLV
jgi:hypothetical protein